MVTPLNNCNNNNHLNRKIVVSLDDKYVGVVFEETSDKILVVSKGKINDLTENYAILSQS
jgi:hypothetical protein